MSSQEQGEVLRQLAEANAQVLQDQPTAEKGCCTLRTKGWSEQKPDITKEACDKMASTGVTATWARGSC